LQVNKTDSAIREVSHHSSLSLFWKTWLSRLSVSGVGVLHERGLVEKTDLGNHSGRCSRSLFPEFHFTFDSQIVASVHVESRWVFDFRWKKGAVNSPSERSDCPCKDNAEKQTRNRCQIGKPPDRSPLNRGSSGMKRKVQTRTKRL
jgi:hypothetical protein